MQTHRNAKLGLSGRFALVQTREAGLSLREVARRFSVSPATVSRWSCRWRAASGEERATLACLFDRSSRPRRMPRLLPVAEQRRICAARRRTGWGPRLLTVATGRPHSTISKVLKRNGLSRAERRPREPVRRYEWPCPGDLLHADWTLYARFARPGHAVTGDRTSSAAERKAKLGYELAHAIVDDHSRLAYAELLPDCRAATVTAFTERALRFFAAHGIETRRLMTDNHWSYTRNRSLREVLARHGIKHLRTPRRRPQPNGKVERFHQTMAREWAYGLSYRSSRHRAAALPHWLRYYNERRPHSSLGGLPPVSRVHNVCGQDN
jgi:transposase InsO family protein